MSFYEQPNIHFTVERRHGWTFNNFNHFGSHDSPHIAHDVIPYTTYDPILSLQKSHSLELVHVSTSK